MSCGVALQKVLWSQAALKSSLGKRQQEKAETGLKCQGRDCLTQLCTRAKCMGLLKQPGTAELWDIFRLS